MYLFKKLGLKKEEVISIVGGGGKTTTLFILADELRNLNKRVLVTTTTAIFSPKEEEYDYYFLGKLEYFTPKEGSITIFGNRIEEGKLKGPSSIEIEEIVEKNIFDFILIEADGSKGKPIKAPNDYEPVIPKCTTKTIGVIGLDSFEKRIDHIVHRPEKFIEITNSNYSDTIDADIIIKLIFHPEGLFKEARGEKILLLNKASNQYYSFKGNEIRNKLLEKRFKGSVLVSDIKTKKFY
ncbi:selenium cofactor biosynthesis protein YqeC [Tepidimicrobium xylanilyticum]|uniref:selenium cofactor biosynthesis protein YqeC n=1 Tax=Tepidimicrobium xylanilyticum TaxID=1123352 RepID=UPI00264CF0D7|nr:selenium cofactor biosynthesis protein YqeC [Tepidimicrobium xylanilyticum]GMG95415.1 hydroxylase accessory protein YqeC [Tepidimicrobium xylanilyticum]